MLGLAALAGGMIFFGAIMAPLVFTKLPPDIAGPFIRATFPRYYIFVIATAAIAALGLALRGDFAATIIMLIIAAITVWLLLWLIPHLNALRDTNQTAAFARGHRLSVWINAAQMLAAVGILARLVSR